MAKVRIKGEAELYAKLKALPAKIAEVERRTVKAEVNETAQDLRRAAPVLSGDLRDSIQEETVKAKSGAAGRVAITARHAEFVIHGTSDTPANDFVTPVVQRAEDRFPKRLREEVQAELKRI